MIKGITEKEEKIIKEILSPYRNEHKFFCYGSRVKGNFEKTSDLDIAIIANKPLEAKFLWEIREKFDESYLPYVVNFLDYNESEKHFQDLIKEDLVEI